MVLACVQLQMCLPSEVAARGSILTCSSLPVSKLFELTRPSAWLWRVSRHGSNLGSTRETNHVLGTAQAGSASMICLVR